MHNSLRKPILYIIISSTLLLGITLSPYINFSTFFQNAKDSNTKFFAVLCGISDYPGYSNDLRYCDDDVEDMAQILTNRFRVPNSNIHILINEEVTRNTLYATITNISMQMDNNSYCMFMFSGHGMVNSTDYSLVVHNQFLDKLTATELQNMLAIIPGTKIIILDTCHSGGVGETLANNNTYVITSCQANEYSKERTELQNGIFSYFLIESWNSTISDDRNNLILEETFPTIYNNTLEYSLSVDGRQHPVEFDGNFDKNIILPLF